MADTSFDKAKMLWFFAKKLTVILIVGLIAFYVYSTSLNITNVLVVTSDGMHELAAQAVMQEEAVPLGDYFSQDIIDEKQVLLTQQYSECNIWDFKYRLKIDPFICLPSYSSITITATEIVSQIDGTGPKVDGQEQPIPAWDNARYKITLRKNSRDQWIITNLEVIEDLPDATVTPEATASPTASN